MYFSIQENSWSSQGKSFPNLIKIIYSLLKWGRHGLDHMVVGWNGSWIFHPTICAISAYHHSSCEFEPHSGRGVLDTMLCDNVCQWLATGPWFSQSTLVSSTNKTDCHDITEILLKVALNTINQPSLLKLNIEWLIVSWDIFQNKKKNQ